MTTISKFSGFRNDVAEDRFELGDFAVCNNVDLDETGRVTKRAGLVQLHAGNYTCVVKHRGFTYAVLNGELGVVGVTFTPLTTVSTTVCYEAVDDQLYWVAGNQHGILCAGELFEWKAHRASAETVVNPLNIDMAPKQGLMEPPIASKLMLYNGRMYFACGEFLMYSEPYDYGYLEPENFIALGAPITTMGYVKTGMYIGTTQESLYLAGADADSLEMKIVASKALDGAYSYIPGQSLPEKLRVDYPVPVWATSQGIIAGLSDGQIINLTVDRLVFPASSKGVLSYRVCSGTPQLVFAIN